MTKWECTGQEMDWSVSARRGPREDHHTYTITTLTLCVTSQHFDITTRQKETNYDEERSIVPSINFRKSYHFSVNLSLSLIWYWPNYILTELSRVAIASKCLVMLNSSSNQIWKYWLIISLLITMDRIFVEMGIPPGPGWIYDLVDSLWLTAVLYWRL